MAKGECSPVQFKGANDVLRGGPAEKYGTEQDVRDLPICRGDNFIISCWKVPTWRERFRVLFGGRIYLWAWARTHPPVSVTTHIDIEPK